MSSDFMPMALDSLSSQASAYASSKTGSTYTEEELRRMGINLVDPEDSGLQFEDFLQLMVSQLQNQTIDNTADTSDMLNQLVQMSVVEMMSKVQTSIDSLVEANTLTYAASLVGKTVTIGVYDDQGNLQELVGEVTGTGTYQGSPVIFVGGEMYALSDIMAVGTLPAAPETPSEGEGGSSGSETETPSTEQS